MKVPLKAGAGEYARFDVLDFYRYGGALFVALDHFTLMYFSVDFWTQQRVRLLEPLMGFFFTLSGFVIMHVYSHRISTIIDYIDYLQKRLARVYPLHIATLAFAILLGVLSSHDHWWFSPKAILPNILLIHAWNTTDQVSFNYPSWSVSAEFFVYLLFPVFLLAVNLLGLWRALLLPLLSILPIYWFFNANGLGSWTTANYAFGCLRAVPSFLAGMVIYRLALVRFTGFVIPAWVAHGFAVATIPMMLFGIPNILMLAVFVLVVFLLARAEPSTPGIFSTPLFRALANSSYGFYMLHGFVGAVIVGILPEVFHLGGIWKLGLTAFALVVTTVISILSFRFFEDPARRYFSAPRMSPITARSGGKPDIQPKQSNPASTPGTSSS